MGACAPRHLSREPGTGRWPTSSCHEAPPGHSDQESRIFLRRRAEPATSSSTVGGLEGRVLLVIGAFVWLSLALWTDHCPRHGVGLFGFRPPIAERSGGTRRWYRRRYIKAPLPPSLYRDGGWRIRSGDHVISGVVPPIPSPSYLAQGPAREGFQLPKGGFGRPLCHSECGRK